MYPPPPLSFSNLYGSPACVPPLQRSRNWFILTVRAEPSTESVSFLPACSHAISVKSLYVDPLWNPLDPP